jgi:hypothetical protein
MEILIYKSKYYKADPIENFLDFYYYTHLNYLASDLLDKELSPNQISDAVVIAIKIAKSSGINIREHFIPVFTDINSEIISDCKLSKLAYGLVLLNANPDLSSVGKWQIKVLENFID